MWPRVKTGGDVGEGAWAFFPRARLEPCLCHHQLSVLTRAATGMGWGGGEALKDWEQFQRCQRDKASSVGTLTGAPASVRCHGQGQIQAQAVFHLCCSCELEHSGHFHSCELVGLALIFNSTKMCYLHTAPLPPAQDD